MLRTILSALRPTGAAFGLMLVFGFAPPAQAQNAPFVPECPSPNPLCLDNNYFVTGDYLVGGVGLRGLGVNGFASGKISIPDCVQAQALNVPCPSLPVVPAGADIIAAFLYWETVESSVQSPPHPGQQGYFKPCGHAINCDTISGLGYPISGAILGNPNAPTSWSDGGCSGSANGAKTIVAYRADVRPYLLQDANGNLQGNDTFQVMLRDSGSNGGGVPLTLGASLVIIYRVLSSAMPLNSIVLYDGAFAPSNQTTNSEMSQTMLGFYQSATSPVVKLTHIVGDGQSNKFEQAFFQGNSLPYLYPAHPNVAFPGIYNGSWDNVTWTANNSAIALQSGASAATTSVTPGSSGGGCVDWGVVIFSTTVQNSDGDGLLDVWKTNGGYDDAISVQNLLPNPFVALPGANPNPGAVNPKVQDVFVEIDYLTDLDGSTGLPKHSHLPKQQALDMVGDAFAKQNIHVHFDVGPTNYAGNCSTTHPAVCPDPYIIANGTGGNAIPESPTLCSDSACQFPGTPSVGWKGGYLSVKNSPTVPGTNIPLGNFQFGRKDSYHYVLFGHALGTSRSFWTTYGATLQSSSFAKLISISNSTLGGGSTFLVTIQTPQGTPQDIIYPGYCPNAGTPACNDSNVSRVTVSGAIGQPALNGTYAFTNAGSQGPDGNGVITTTFQITTTGLPSGTQIYNFNNESRLTVEYLGPTSTSGHSDFPGGADTAVTFGLWSVDDPSGCQQDPAVALTQGQTYCDDETGTIQAQAGTLLHEMGHTFALAHGGIFYPAPGNPNGTLVPGGQQANDSPFFAPAFGLNCNPAILSSMNYLFQIRGFPDPLPLMLQDGNVAHPIDYSGQTLSLPPAAGVTPSGLFETRLYETFGIGSDLFTGSPAPHFTRWYGPPTALQVQAGQHATAHCDGTPVGPNEPLAVRIDGTTFSALIDWNNNMIIDPIEPIGFQDVNFNGSTSALPDPPAAPAFDDMQGYNDWTNLDLRQIASRENAIGFSGGGGTAVLQRNGGGVSILQRTGGGATAYAEPGGGGTAVLQRNGGGALGNLQAGGGGDQNLETACSTADPPVSLAATLGTKSVVLNWKAPGGPCKVQTYSIWRSTNGGPFTLLVTLARGGNGKTAPLTTFTDTNVKNNNTYTYFVTDTDRQGATSDGTNQVTVTVTSK